MARMSLTENLLDGGNAVAAISQGIGLAQQKVQSQQATQTAAAAAQPSTYASGFQTTPSSGDPGSGGDGSQDDGSQDDGGGDPSQGGGDDGSDGGSEADFQQFVQQYYAANPQAAAAPADPNAAQDPNAVAAQPAAAPQAPQGAQANGGGRPHPHRGFFARLLAALSGEDPQQAAQTQQAIVAAVQQVQAQQQAQVAAPAADSADTAGTSSVDDGIGLEVDGGWTRNNQDWSPSSYGAEQVTYPGQGPVSIYAQNGILTATGMTQSPYGKLPVCVGVACPVPMNNGPVQYGRDPEVDTSISCLRQILFDKSLYEAQRDAAAHLVLSARLGDQVAFATLNQIKAAADKGDVRAASAQAIVLDFIRKNPVDENGFGGDTSDAGSANPLQRSVNQLADGPALSAGRVRAIATSFGGGSRRRRAVVFHGMMNHDDSPETVATCDAFAARLTKVEKELHHMGRLIGRARGLQMARRKNGKISDFDKRSGLELGERPNPPTGGGK